MTARVAPRRSSLVDAQATDNRKEFVRSVSSLRIRLVCRLQERGFGRCALSGILDAIHPLQETHLDLIRKPEILFGTLRTNQNIQKSSTRYRNNAAATVPPATVFLCIALSTVQICSDIRIHPRTAHSNKVQTNRRTNFVLREAPSSIFVKDSAARL